jgi:hypothetical protein
MLAYTTEQHNRNNITEDLNKIIMLKITLEVNYQ